MAILHDSSLNFNSKIKMNFDGGDLSSDAGLLLIEEFVNQLGFPKIVKSAYKTKDSAVRRHKDDENLWQVILQIITGYFSDDSADELTNDPAFTTVLNKSALASQPTLSRFFNRMDETTLEQLNELTRKFRKVVYGVERPPHVLLDLDSTLLETYGHQEGEGFNYHYQTHGYHPLVCFDGTTGDLLKIQLREGKKYTSTGVVEFLQPILDEFNEDYPDISLFLRADSGFATPELYEQCEINEIGYAIRLKENKVLLKKIETAEAQLFEKTKEDIISYTVEYGEFPYRAKSWGYDRRVVYKIEKPQGQMSHLYTFIVTNMEASPERIIRFYSKRGIMENFIKECKNAFNFSRVSSHSEIVNANRLQIHALAYNIFNWFRRLVLPAGMKNLMADTIRLCLLKVAARIVRSAGYRLFKLCSNFPHKSDFEKTLENIHRLRPKLAW